MTLRDEYGNCYEFVGYDQLDRATHALDHQGYMMPKGDTRASTGTAWFRKVEDQSPSQLSYDSTRFHSVVETFYSGKEEVLWLDLYAVSSVGKFLDAVAPEGCVVVQVVVDGMALVFSTTDERYHDLVRAWLNTA